MQKWLSKIDTEVFLDDFQIESKLHLEEIESAFLNADVLANDPKMMDKIFRAAHSIKGSAGFFSLTKIVAVAHGLENVFSQIKDGDLAIDEEITDLALKSVDCLVKLVDNVHSDDSIDTEDLVETLKKYSKTEKPDTREEETEMPFTFNDPSTKKELENAARYGHKLYYVNINFNRSLGQYYKYPDNLISNFLSIGSIVEAVVNKNTEKIIKGTNSAELTEKIITELTVHDTSKLELLVTSVLELELFAAAADIDKKYIRHLPGIKKEFSEDSNELSGSDLSKQETVSGIASEQKGNFSIRLDVSAINNLMDLTNEMILSRNQLLSAVSDYRKSIPGLAPVLHDMNRLTTAIQEKVMLTRMQPVSVIFSKFPRIIRNTAKALNKDIQIEISGENVALDKYLLDSLADPITQIVKNAADHGVEQAERRLRLNKPPKGTITLNAYMGDGSAVIEVSDDGSGIDTEVLKRKSIELGKITEETAASMSKSEILDLVFEPGITTANEITNLSGRGVGMDIVKTNIEKLKGSIEIDSEIDKGTTVRLKIPLTLSAIRSLIVSIDNILYAVPETNVERIVRIQRDAPSKRLERVNKSIVLSLDGQIIPVVTMKEIEAKIKGQALPSAEEELEKRNECDVTKCLVLKEDDKSFALLIDDALQTEQILINSLPVFFKNCPCYSNVTVLGNGNTIMILDARGIIRLMGIEAAADIANEKNEEAQAYKKDEKQIIIFQCSGTEYYALETSEILRVETIHQNDVQEIGEEYFVNIADTTVRAVRPEDFAPVKKSDYTEDKLYLLRLKKSVSPIGLLAGKVLDMAEGVFALDTDRIKSEFVFGTGIYNKKIVIFLNSSAIARKIEKERKIKKNAIKTKRNSRNLKKNRKGEKV